MRKLFFVLTTVVCANALHAQNGDSAFFLKLTGTTDIFTGKKIMPDKYQVVTASKFAKKKDFFRLLKHTILHKQMS